MPQQQKDYSGFDRMSTEMLEEILRADFELSDEESDMDMILYVMEVIAKRKKEAQNREYPDAEQAWKSFNENYRSNPEKPWYEDDDEEDDDDNNTVIQSEAAAIPKVVNRKHPFRRFSIVAVAAIIICCTAFTANAMGYNIWQIFVQWTSQTFGFVSSEPVSQDGTSSQYNSLQEALDAYGVTEKVAPTWVPMGYELASVEVNISSTEDYFSALYENENDYIRIVINRVDNDDYSSSEKDDSVIEIIEAGGIKHYIMSNLEYDTVGWVNGKNECYIISSVSRDELKKMIQSIYKR